MSWFNLGEDETTDQFNKEIKKYYEKTHISKGEAESIPPDYDETQDYDEDIQLDIICPFIDETETRGRKKGSAANVIRRSDIRRPITPKARKLVFKRAGEMCEYCQKFPCLEVHHKDGDPSNDSIDNYMAVCANCHRDLDAKIREIRNIKPWEEHLNDWNKPTRYGTRKGGGSRYSSNNFERRL